MTIPEAKAVLDKECKKLQILLAWDESTVNSKKGDTPSKIRRKGTSFDTQMDLCLLKHSEMENMFQMFKGRVELRGVIVKHDFERCYCERRFREKRCI